MLDVRKPIGWLFTVYGVLLVAYGAICPVNTTIEAQHLSFNLNIVWGVLMGSFGILMNVLAVRDKSIK